MYRGGSGIWENMAHHLPPQAEQIISRQKPGDNFATMLRENFRMRGDNFACGELASSLYHISNTRARFPV